MVVTNSDADTVRTVPSKYNPCFYSLFIFIYNRNEKLKKSVAWGKVTNNQSIIQR